MAESVLDKLLSDDFEEKNPPEVEDAPQVGAEVEEKIPEEEPAGPVKEPPQEGPETLEEAAQEIQRLKRENESKLKEIKSQRKKKRTAEERAEKFAQAISDISARRKELSEEPGPEPEQLPKGLPIEFDDDGNAFLAVDKLTEAQTKIIAPLANRLEGIEKTFVARSQAENINTSIQGFIEGVAKEDPGLTGAVPRFQEAWAWLKDAMESKREELGPAENFKTVGMVVDACDDTGISTEFSKRYGIDPAALLRSFDSKRDLKHALSGLAGQKPVEKPKDKLDKHLKDLASKPSNLSGLRNSKIDTQKTLDDIAEMSNADFMSFKDEDWAKLDRLLEEEERKAFN